MLLDVGNSSGRATSPRAKNSLSEYPNFKKKFHPSFIYYILAVVERFRWTPLT